MKSRLCPSKVSPQLAVTPETRGCFGNTGLYKHNLTQGSTAEPAALGQCASGRFAPRPAGAFRPAGLQPPPARAVTPQGNQRSPARTHRALSGAAARRFPSASPENSGTNFFPNEITFGVCAVKSWQQSAVLPLNVVLRAHTFIMWFPVYILLPPGFKFLRFLIQRF